MKSNFTGRFLAPKLSPAVTCAARYPFRSQDTTFVDECGDAETAVFLTRRLGQRRVALHSGYDAVLSQRRRADGDVIHRRYVACIDRAELRDVLEYAV